MQRLMRDRPPMGRRRHAGVTDELPVVIGATEEVKLAKEPRASAAKGDGRSVILRMEADKEIGFLRAERRA